MGARISTHNDPFAWSEIQSKLEPVYQDNSTTAALCSRGIVEFRCSPISKVKVLQLCCNKIQQFPPDLNKLQYLTLLQISKNQIVKIPTAIGSLKCLQELDVSSNLIQLLPMEINMLRKLVVLRISNNPLLRLPNLTIKSLKHLDARKTKLTCIPESISRLPLLRTLLLDSCPLLTFNKVGFIGFLDLETTTITKAALDLIQSFKQKQIPFKKTNILSLREIAARKLSTMGIYTKIMGFGESCSFCDLKFFKSFELRYKFIQKRGIDVPLEFKLCKNHFLSENERIKLLFAPRVNLAMPVVEGKIPIKP